MSGQERQGRAQGPEAEPKESVEAADAKQAAEGTLAEEAASAPGAEGSPRGEQADDKSAEQDQPQLPARRRGAAETTTGATRRRRREADGAVVVRARARYVRTAPRKARLVMEHIRGKPVEEARALLSHTPRAASKDVLKLLDSAVANAESEHELGSDELRVQRAFVDEGPTIKRYRPRALGRATRINKRTSHMTITLVTTDSEGAR